MSDPIDLTAESPPRTSLHLPGGTVSRESFQPAGHDPRSTSRRSARQARSDRQAARGEASNGESSRMGAARNSSATAAPPDSHRGQSSRTRRSSTADDDIEVTYMSEGARLAAERAQRTAAETARLFGQYLPITAFGQPADHRSVRPDMYGQGQAPAGFQIHDTLAPGPHRRGPPRAARPPDAFPAVSASDDPAGMSHRLMQLVSQLHGRLRTNVVLPSGHHATAFFEPRRTQDVDAVLPEKHDPRLVTNRSKHQPDQPGFTYAIIEPPVDVETYDEDPRIITGPLPDTSAICAGCDCALVRGGLGQRKLWAFPCGHVFDARCFDRYCSGISATKARRLARLDIKEEEEKAIANLPSAEKQPCGDKTLLQPMKRSALEMEGEESSHLIDVGLGGASTAPDSPNKSARVEAVTDAASGAHIRAEMTQQGSEESLTEDEPEQQESRRSRSRPQDEGRVQVVTSPLPTKAQKPVPKVLSFKCPVDGCHQRISTSAGKASSAVELFM